MQERYVRMYQLHAELKEFQFRIRQACTTISDFLRSAERPYVSWSGGKDSQALLLLLARMGHLEIPVFTQADDLDWPEKRDFCHCIVASLGFTDYTYAQSDVSAMDQFSAHAPDHSIRGTFSHVVQRYTQERNRDGVMLGLRSEESRGRKLNRATSGKLYQVQSGEWRCTPIADWKGMDVFALILSEQSPYLHVYDCDTLTPPHEIRCSWMIQPELLTRGQAVWLKHYYPVRFNHLAQINFRLRAYV